MRKGIGPNNLGAGPAGCPTCGPACDCDQPEAVGQLNEGFRSLPMDVQEKIAPDAAGKMLGGLGAMVAKKAAGALISKAISQKKKCSYN